VQLASVPSRVIGQALDPTAHLHHNTANMDPSAPSRRRLPPPKEPLVIIGDYQRLNEIGKGSFAMVYRGVHVVSHPL